MNFSPVNFVRSMNFEYELDPVSNKYVVVSKDYKKIKEKLIRKYTNGGRPIIYLENVRHNDNEIMLQHEYDGRPLDKKYGKGVLKMLYKITRRVINITTMYTEPQLYYTNDMKVNTKAKNKRVVYRYDGREFSTIENKKSRPKMWGNIMGAQFVD